MLRRVFVRELDFAPWRQAPLAVPEAAVNESLELGDRDRIARHAKRRNGVPFALDCHFASLNRAPVDVGHAIAIEADAAARVPDDGEPLGERGAALVAEWQAPTLSVAAAASDRIIRLDKAEQLDELVRIGRPDKGPRVNWRGIRTPFSG